MTGPLRQAWEDQAAAWAVWARTPGHDTFWHHTLPELLAILPGPGRRTLDLGGGEGRLARELTARGHTVTAFDGSPTLTRLAARHDAPTVTVLADLAQLPVRGATADLAVACLSLQDVDDLAGAVREAARVLVPGGRLCLVIVHPINSAGRFASDAPGSAFVVTGSYLDEFHYSDHAERDGLTMTFHSMHRPLEAYSLALEDAGLLIETIREPAWSNPGPSARYNGWDRLPMFCFVRAVRPD